MEEDGSVLDRRVRGVSVAGAKDPELVAVVEMHRVAHLNGRLSAKITNRT